MIEILERRELLSTTWTVNSTGDAGTGSGTIGDLRWCIEQVNATTGSQVIDFAITGARCADHQTHFSLTDNQPAGHDRRYLRGYGDGPERLHRDTADRA